MKITVNDAVNSYFDSCRKNLSNTALNRFLDRRVNPSNAKTLAKKLKQAGSQEFDGPEAQWPSLFLSVNDWYHNPYHREITSRLSSLNQGIYETMIFEGRRLFNADAVQPDRHKALGDWMKLRALDQDGETLVLVNDGIEWMLDAPGEHYTNDPIARQSHGNVVTFGLGIGYYLFMALRNPAVSHVTVVEQSETVISLFQELIAPLFEDQRFTVIHGDAYDYWNSSFLNSFDFIYADIWQSGDDGLFIMRDLLSQVYKDHHCADFWIEDSCVVPLRTLIYLCYQEIAFGARQKVHPDYEPLMNQVRRYFDHQSILIQDPKALQYYMYDRDCLRTILGGIL